MDTNNKTNEFESHIIDNRREELVVEVKNYQPEEQHKEKGYLVDWEKQPREKTDGTDLVQSIRERGLLTFIVFVATAALDMLVEGHRRMHALWLFKVNYPKEYEEMFPKGVPCKVVTGIKDKTTGKKRPLSILETDALRADHDEDSYRQGLSSLREVVKYVKPFFDAGCTMTTIQKQCWRTVARVLSPKSFEAVKTEIGEVIANTSLTTAEKDKKIWASTSGIVDKALHGQFQHLKRCCEANKELLEMHLLTREGKEGGIEGMTAKEFEKLVMSMKKEIEDAAKVPGGKAYTKDNPGPMYRQAVQDLINKKLSTSTEKKPERPKVSDIEATLQKLTSAGLRTPLQYSLGNTAALPIMMNLDPILAKIETIDQKNHEMLDAFITVGVTGTADDCLQVLNTCRGILEPTSRKSHKK